MFCSDLEGGSTSSRGAAKLARGGPEGGTDNKRSSWSSSSLPGGWDNSNDPDSVLVFLPFPFGLAPGRFFGETGDSVISDPVYSYGGSYRVDFGELARLSGKPDNSSCMGFFFGRVFLVILL